jgi:hypothetical protein
MGRGSGRGPLAGPHRFGRIDNLFVRKPQAGTDLRA